MSNFYKNLKGCKVNIASKNGTESFIGMISNVYEETWLELVPFADEPLQEKFKDFLPDLNINSTPLTILKRLSSIDTIIILDKPDPNEYGQRNTESTEGTQT
jgi:hypothetical protein